MKFVKYIIIVLLGLIVCDKIISFCFESLMKNRYVDQINRTYASSADMAVLGASRAAHHYIPQVLGDSLNLEVTNFGIDGQNIFTHYIVLKSLTEHSKDKPKIVLLEVGAIDINDTPKWNTEKLNILFPYFHSEKYIREILKDLLSPGEYWSLKLFGLYRHNSNYVTYLHQLLTGFPAATDGYSPLYKEWSKPIQYEEEQGTTTNPQKIEYFKKFILLCKQENIQLIVAVSPNYKLLPDQKWVGIVKQITTEENVPFLYHESDSLFLSHSEWFNEPFHLNDKGATVYSGMISEELKEIYTK